MTALNFLGGATPSVSTSFTDRWVSTAAGVDLPTTGRLADNGNKPIYVATAGCYWAGRGAARQLALSIGGASTGWKTVASAGSAYSSGQMAIGAVFQNGGTAAVRIDANGVQSFYFGRASGTGSVDSYGTSFGKLSGSLEYYEVPSAPLSVTASQATTENAVNVAWSAPSSNGGSAVTSYTIKWSYTSDFASSTTISTGNTSTSYKITGLSYGSVVYVKVAAVNVVATAAATTSVYSSSANAYLVPPNLPLNGWANFGTHGGSTFEIVHTSITALIPETGIQRKATSSTATGTYATGNFGIEKTYTDLVPGRSYTISGKAILLTAAVPGNIYRFAVNGIGNGSSVTLTSTTVGATIPTYTFTASSTTHTIQIELAETVSAIVGVMEHVAFYDYALTRTAVDLAYRVQDNNLSASLVRHFDLATQSVGAFWWVDKLNVTQFTQNFNFTIPTCTFSDVIADGNLYYTGIKTSFDTSTVINDITFDNIGRRRDSQGSERFDAYSVAWNENSPTSVANWGARKYDLQTNLYTAVNRENLVPNPNLQNSSDYLLSPAGYGTVTMSRQTIASLSTGATGFLPVGTTQPVAGAGAYVASAFRGSSLGNTAIVYGGADSVGSEASLIAVNPSTQYTFSAYMRTGVGQSTSGNGSIIIVWFDVNGAVVSIPTGPSSAISATAWTRYSYTQTSPATARYAKLYANFGYTGANNNGFRYYATCPQIEAASSASTWFSGDTTDDATYVYEWEGVQGNSRSIRYLNQMDSRTGELLTQFATPITRVQELTYNTAQNPTIAASLDIGSLVNIVFKGNNNPTYRTNLCVNPNFETNTTNWTPINGTLSRVTTTPQAGTYCAQMTADGDGDLSVRYERNSSLVIGTQYRGGIYVRVSTGTQSLTLVLADGFGGQAQTTFTATTSWQFVSTGSMTAVNTNARIIVYGSGVGANVFIDSAIIETASTWTGTFFDGNTPSAGNTVYEWRGTPNASNSTAITTNNPIYRVTGISHDINPERWMSTLQVAKV